MAITPYLLYRDAGAALEWLAAAFGLRPSGDVYKDQAGRVTHASMVFGSAGLMLGSPGPEFKGPKALGHATTNLYVDVDDVDAHYSRAVAAGATIIEEPVETFYGARRYGAEDLEGHRWYFAQDLARRRRSGRQSPRKAPAMKTKERARKRT